ncbi:MAG: DUF1266 domain-containing protein [Treponema sp.]|jgi:hypothetical protein|nr:DUF1266 domain-containing protein [Treponema sp.]
MKKHLVFVIIFLIINSSLFAELTRAQMWAISLTGIMTEINSSYRNSLNAYAMDASGRNTSWRLFSSWGITRREQLLETLDSLERGGHSASLREIQDIVYELSNARSESERTDILIKVRSDQSKNNRLTYVLANWDEYQNRTLRAWDLGRGISLCRWGYNVGIITEKEAWDKIFHFAGLIQALYNSWEEYGYDYFMGRLFMYSSISIRIAESTFAITEPVYRKLLDSYWGWLDWDIDFDEPETAVPVNTIRFLRPDDNDGTAQYWNNDPALYGRYSYHYMPNPNENQNVYECRVRKISGCDTSGYGILFCVDDTDRNNLSYYRLYITVNGRFTVQKRIGSTWATAPVGWKDSSFINTGYNVNNTLWVERNDTDAGALFWIYINDNLVAFFKDASPINGRKAGMSASTGDMEMELFPFIPVDVRFDF